MRILNWLKALVFIITGVLTFCFHNFLFGMIDKNLNIFVGAIILLFSLEPIFLIFVKKYKEELLLNITKGLITFCLGLLMIFLVKSISAQILLSCVIWSIWSILRELDEIRINIFKKIRTTPVCASLNIFESIIIVTLVVIFVINHEPRGIDTHLYILGIELLLEGIWPFAYKLELTLKYLK